MDDSSDVFLRWPDVDARCRGILNSSFPWLASTAVAGLMAEVKTAFDHAPSNGGFSMREALRRALWPIVVTPELLNGILSFTYRLCGNKHDAEDICQDVCVKLIEKLLTWHCEGEDWNFKAWFYQCSRREAIDSYRRRRAKTRRVPDDAARVPEDGVADQHVYDPARSAQYREEKRRLRQLIMQLPPKKQQAIFLHYFAGLSTIDIADALSITGKDRAERQRKVSNLLADAVRRLRELQNPNNE